MARKMKYTVGNVVVYILLLMLLALAIAFLAKFTNGFTSDVKTFYVICNDETILNDKGNYLIYANEEYRFDVKYTFGFLQKDNEKLGYHVKVVPYVTEDTNFDFYADGEMYNYGAESDLTSGFDIRLYEDYFTFTATKGMEGILQAIYPNKTLTDIPQLNSGIDYYMLVISSEDYSAEIKITFSLHFSIELSSDKLVF